MSFRVKFHDPSGLWWTEAIANWVDCCTLIHQQRQLGLSCDAYVNTRPLELDVERLVAGALAEQQASGQSAIGELRWGCTCGKCNLLASTAIVRVPRGSPSKVERPQPKVAPCDEDRDDVPRELRGPTAEDLAPHAPAAAAGKHEARGTKSETVTPDPGLDFCPDHSPGNGGGP
jgi:hypothetical protein